MPFKKGHQINRKEKVRSAWIPGIRTYEEIAERLDAKVAELQEINPELTKSRFIERCIAKNV